MVRYSISLTEDLDKRINKLGEKQVRNKSNMILYLITKALKEEEKEVS